MGIFKFDSKDYFLHKFEDRERRCIKQSALEKFNPNVLGLGEINVKAERREVICAIFDLSGFTDFCKQIDPRLAIPSFLSSYLAWFFTTLRTCFVDKKTDSQGGGVAVWTEPPFFSKFMGDGLLFLWDAEKLDPISMHNVVGICSTICSKYKKDFLKKASCTMAYLPSKLRCGIARGDVYAVGNGSDFVGPCINLASRLQKLGPLSFVVSKRGFDFSEHMDESMNKLFVLQRANIRGIGSDELVYVLAQEVASLNREDRKIIKRLSK